MTLPREAWTPVFIVGSPRSGTTWLQSLLDFHPRVATSRETHLFSGYLQRLVDRWQFDADRAEEVDSYYQVGLPAIMDEDDFLGLCEDLAVGVLGRIARQNPDCEVVVEKTPDHARYAELILALFPEARFIHIVRDPRSVVASLRKANMSWGHYWAPDSLVACARRWKTFVRAAREIEDLTADYYELSYEALHDSTAEHVRDLYGWLRLDADASFVERAVEACSLDDLRDRDEEASEDPLGPADDTPEGFFRKGAARSWTEDLARHEIGLVEHLCREEMEDLGYRTTGRDHGLAPVRVKAKQFVDRVRGGLDWRLERLSKRL